MQSCPPQIYIYHVADSMAKSLPVVISIVVFYLSYCHPAIITNMKLMFCSLRHEDRWCEDAIGFALIIILILYLFSGFQLLLHTTTFNHHFTMPIFILLISNGLYIGTNIEKLKMFINLLAVVFTGMNLFPCGLLESASKNWTILTVWILTWPMTSSPLPILVSYSASAFCFPPLSC